LKKWEFPYIWPMALVLRLACVKSRRAAKGRPVGVDPTNRNPLVAVGPQAAVMGIFTAEAANATPCMESRRNSALTVVINTRTGYAPVQSARSTLGLEAKGVMNRR